MPEKEDDLDIEYVGEEQRPKERGGVTKNLSRTPIVGTFINKQEKRNIESLTEAIGAATEFGEAVIKHEAVKARLQGVGVEIATDRLERKNRLRDAERKAETAELEDKRAQLTLQLETKKLKQEIEALDNPPTIDSPPTKRPPPKSKKDRVLEQRERWERTKEELRSEGLSESDEEWQRLENDHEQRVRNIFE